MSAIFKNFPLLLVLAVICGIVTVSLVFGSTRNNRVIEKLNHYSSEGLLDRESDFGGLESIFSTDRMRFLIGWAGHNFLYDARELMPNIETFAINEQYNPDWLNIYVIDPEKDRFGVLNILGVESAKGFPNLRLVVVNKSFARKLKDIPVTIAPVDAPDLSSDFITLRLEKPIEGAVPFTEQESRELYTGYLTIYLLIHEIGHIAYGEEIKQKAGKVISLIEQELFADRFFISCLLHMAGAKALRDDNGQWDVMFLGQIINSLHAYFSDNARNYFGRSANDMLYSNDHYKIAISPFSTHPPMLFRILELFRLLEEANSEDEQFQETLKNNATIRIYNSLNFRLEVEKSAWALAKSYWH